MDIATTGPAAAAALEVRRVIPAPRDRVFRAWTEAATVSRWFAPTDDYTTIVHALDVRVDGRYRIEMRHKDGAQHVAIGAYREIAPPERLAFTWKWEGQDMPETVVTLQLLDRGAETELVLRHTGLPSTEMRNRHQEGWFGCLGRLATKV
ncbi:MAG TPA: SRPBCC domain-containing protein [Gemmatimonadales bacterium]|jgi:uncharacterized protein YndB with AHSA1/START domain|nr:SRPBCC domain-containing protein [Gemmatimonadales bacterium]